MSEQPKPRPYLSAAEIAAAPEVHIRHPLNPASDVHLRALGRFAGLRPMIPTLATLAFYQRRAAYFREELFNALLVVDPNTPNEEVIELGPETAGGSYVFNITYRRPHTKGAVIIARGNPGPWLKYDPKQDTDVVPLFAIID